MAEAANPRSPKSEKYGRSFSTIHKLGALMVDKPLLETVRSPEAAQVRVEFYTSVEEGFGTDVELSGGLEVRDFDTRPIINGKVMAKDLKTAVSDMTEAGLLCALETFANDQRFLPQLVRSEHDHTNALFVDAMASGETDYNTRIVVSPFPEEAAAKSGDAYWRHIGYVPHLKRGFVQLYHVTENGELVAGSLSFDGANKQKIRHIFAKHGVEIPEGEITDNWLNYAFKANLSEEDAKAVATQLADQLDSIKRKETTNTVDVTREYGPLIDQVFNESYVHICESLYRGYQTKGTIALVHQLTDKAHHFNHHYRNALYKMRANKHQFTDDESAALHDLLVYSTIEMMRALHLKKQALALRSDTKAQDYSESMLRQIQSLDSTSFQSLLSSFGAEGAMNNRGYSACGTAINAGEEKSPLRPQSVFGGVDQLTEATEDSRIPKIINCIKCKLPSPKEKVVNDEKKTWSCPHCKYEIDVCTGVVINESNKNLGTTKSMMALLIDELDRRKAKTRPKRTVDTSRVLVKS